MLRGAEGITKEGDFVKAYMPDDDFPEDLADTLIKIYQRWNWYDIQADGDNKAYYRRFALETFKIDIKAKLEGIEKDSPYGKGCCQ
jgi:hypothetical protein